MVFEKLFFQFGMYLLAVLVDAEAGVNGRDSVHRFHGYCRVYILPYNHRQNITSNPNLTRFKSYSKFLLPFQFSKSQESLTMKLIKFLIPSILCSALMRPLVATAAFANHLSNLRSPRIEKQEAYPNNMSQYRLFHDLTPHLPQKITSIRETSPTKHLSIRADPSFKVGWWSQVWKKIAIEESLPDVRLLVSRTLKRWDEDFVKEIRKRYFRHVDVDQVREVYENIVSHPELVSDD